MTYQGQHVRPVTVHDASEPQERLFVILAHEHGLENIGLDETASLGRDIAGLDD